MQADTLMVKLYTERCKKGRNASETLFRARIKEFNNNVTAQLGLIRLLINKQLNCLH